MDTNFHYMDFRQGGTSKTEVVRVVILVRKTSYLYDLAICEVS